MMSLHRRLSEQKLFTVLCIITGLLSNTRFETDIQLHLHLSQDSLLEFVP